MIGVIYKWNQYNKINGTLFYCFEYFNAINKYKDVNFYIIGITEDELAHVIDIFKDKYNQEKINIDKIIRIKVTKLRNEKLEKTLILDVKTFKHVRAFLTGKIICFSNDTHEMFRYNDERRVTYYGSYDYQCYDYQCYLKINFDIFQDIKISGNKLFVSNLFGTTNIINPDILRDNQLLKKEIIYKDSTKGFINLFKDIDTVYLIHSGLDTNNRIILEGYFYNKKIIIDDRVPQLRDSVVLRSDDIKINGLKNYTLDKNCLMIQAMIC